MVDPPAIAGGTDFDPTLFLTFEAKPLLHIIFGSSKGPGLYCPQTAGDNPFIAPTT